jgi:hypothetical protein
MKKLSEYEAVEFDLRTLNAIQMNYTEDNSPHSLVKCWQSKTAWPKFVMHYESAISHEYLKPIRVS